MDVTSLLRHNEGKTLEYKRDLSSPSKIINTIIAFANTAGGTILVGIDQTRDIRGIDDPLAAEERLASIIADSIEPLIIPNISIVNVRDRAVIAIEIPLSQLRPHFVKKLGADQGTYVRVGSTNRKADTALINEIKRAPLQLTFDTQVLRDENSESLDLRAASELFADIHEWTPQSAVSLGLHTTFNGVLKPTIGGYLLFGKERSRLFPDAWIQCGRFLGTDKSEIHEQIEIREYLPIALRDAYAFVQKHNSRQSEIADLQRTDRWNIPMIAVREALTNAIVHADYSQTGAPIRVALFNDRIEIENPGLFPSGLTVEDIQSGVSKVRNRTIARVFKELRFIEQWGSGYQRMQKNCAELKLPNPIYEEVGFRVRLTIRLLAIHSPKSSIAETIVSYISSYEAQGGISTNQLSELLGLSTRSIRGHIARLLDEGQIIAIGRNANDPLRKFLISKD
jgi:ATP-dependent DNA helicase RecG